MVFVKTVPNGILKVLTLDLNYLHQNLEPYLLKSFELFFQIFLKALVMAFYFGIKILFSKQLLICVFPNHVNGSFWLMLLCYDS